MVKLNNIVIFACNEGGHFAQLMALKELFSKYDSVIHAQIKEYRHLKM